jgi:diguanylate cyclase (GGDEF)-like protein
MAVLPRIAAFWLLAVFQSSAVVFVATVAYAPDGIAAILLATATVAQLGLTAIAGTLRPGDESARALTLTCVLTTGTWILYPYPPLDAGTLAQIAYSAFHNLVFFLTSAALFHMCTRLPVESPVARRHPALARVGYAVALAFAIFATLLQLNAHERIWDGLPADAAEAHGIVRLLVVAMYAAAALGGSALVAAAGLAAPSLLARRQAILLCAALVPYGAFRAASAAFPALSGSPLFATLDWTAPFLIGLGLFLTVHGYHLFATRPVLGRGAVLTLTLALLLTGTYTLALTANLVLQHEASAGTTFALACAGSALLLRPALRHVSSVVDTIFFPERVAVRHLGREVLERVAQHTDLRLLSMALASSVREALALPAAAVYVDDERGAFELYGFSGSAPPPRSLDPAAALAAAPTPFARVLPIQYRVRTVALLAVAADGEGAPLDTETVDGLALAAAHVGAAVENARLFALAMRDSLTGLYRRAVFEERLASAAALFERHGTPVALVLVDVDDFKQVNDGHGHLAGDRVLREVAATVLGACRETDTAARWGGEELALLLPGADGAAAQAVAEKIRVAIAAIAIDVDGRAIRVTASFGAAAMQPGLSAVELIARADAALYRAKRTGKNRVECDEREVGEP